MKEQIPQNESPFKDPPENAGIGDRDELQKLRSDPTKVIRVTNLREFREHEEYSKNVLEGKRLFDELVNKYKIRVAPTSFVIGGKGEEGVLYTITEKVNGKTLDVISLKDFDEKERGRFAVELDGLLERLFLYIGDKIGGKESMFWDVTKQSQYVYGNTAKDSEKHLYLVDTDIQFSVSGTDGFHPFSNSLVALENLWEFKELFQVRFPGAERAARALIAKIRKEKSAPSLHNLSGVWEENIKKFEDGLAE